MSIGIIPTIGSGGMPVLWAEEKRLPSDAASRMSS